MLVVALVVFVVMMIPNEAADPDPNDVARQNRPAMPQFPARRVLGGVPRVPNISTPNIPVPNIPRPNIPNIPVRNVPEPPKLDLIAWNVEVDPPPEIYEFDVKKDIRIPTGDRFGAGSMVLPATPTAFVLVGTNRLEREKSKVYDLRTGKKVADITGIKIDPNVRRLSQDGKFLVARLPIEGDLLVYDVQAEKPLGKIPTKQHYPFLQTFELPGSKRIVAWARDKPVTIWSLPAGDLERTIELPKRFEVQSISFSPGGRYMTVIHENNQILRVYDLDNGQPVGELAAPLDERNRAEGCLCLAFSQDGKELADCSVRSSRGWWHGTWRTERRSSISNSESRYGRPSRAHPHIAHRLWSGFPIAASGWCTVTPLLIAKQVVPFGRPPSIQSAPQRGA